MSSFWQHLLLFEKFEIKTKISKARVSKLISDLGDSQYNDYYAVISEDGFVVGEKIMKVSGAFRSRNSFAPIATATVTEEGDLRVIRGTLRMNTVALVFFVPLYVLSAVILWLFPFMLLLTHFAVWKSAKKLREDIENILSEQ